MSPRFRSAALALAGVLALAAASSLRPSLLDRRQKELGSEAPVAAPPDVAVAAVFLGAFRGLVVDYLWLRALRLEDEGQYFEASDLADWIAKLEPRLEQVWSFKAHALAYNASVATEDPAQRWRWIQKGVAFLRDKGIEINPRSPELYFMLSRIYSDRVGQSFDDHHRFLKRAVTVEMSKGFGPPEGEVPLADLASAPATVAELGPEPRQLALALLAGSRRDGFDGTVEELDDLLRGSASARKVWEDATPGARGPLEACVRAAWLRRVKVDPKVVLELDASYGPLDWRGCDAQALYWAVLGARAARSLGPERAAKEERRLERLAISAVKNALRRGRLIVEPDGTTFFAPVPELATRVISLYEDAIERAKAAAARGETASADEDEDDDGHHHEGAANDAANAVVYSQSLEDAEKDFFGEAILVLAQYGRESDSRKVYAKLATRHPESALRSWEDFVAATLRMEVLGGDAGGATLVTTQQVLFGTWTSAWRALAMGDDERAIGQAAIADRMSREWNAFVRQKEREGDLNAPGRLGATDLARIKARALEDVKAKLSPPLRERLEQRAKALEPSREADK